MRKYTTLTLLPLLAASIVVSIFAPVSYASNNKIISDSVFINEYAMSEAQINSFINSFPGSCLLPQNYPSNLSPYTFYEPNSYFDHGSRPTTPARIISKMSSYYHINPQVILTTLEKENGLVSGNAIGGCAAWHYNSAMGYNCPDTLTLHTYANLGISNTCVERESNAGFARQVNHAAWQLRFDEERAYGNISWGDDGSVYYYGRMTQGWRSRVAGGASTYYDGYTTIDGQAVYLENGSTAALYNYTPHFNSFERIFTNWFGSTQNFILPGCIQATNTSLSCVWRLIATSDSSNLYVIDYATAQSLVSSGKYQYSGFAFLTRNPYAPQAGNIPVYSVTVGSGNLLTTSQNEYDTLRNNGYKVNSIVFYADPPGSNSGYPVFRLSGPSGHVFTSSESERKNYLSQGYVDEGVAFTALSPVKQETAPPADQLLVYRFAGMPSGRHFWTTDLNERDSMILSGYTYEGVAWKAYNNSSTGSPVYRLSTPVLKKHLFTVDENEKNVLLASSSWVYEGVAWYANTVAPNQKPTYRLYLKNNAENFLTNDANERSILLRSGIANDEGTVWYNP